MNNTDAKVLASSVKVLKKLAAQEEAETQLIALLTTTAIEIMNDLNHIFYMLCHAYGLIAPKSIYVPKPCWFYRLVVKGEHDGYEIVPAAIVSFSDPSNHCWRDLAFIGGDICGTMYLVVKSPTDWSFCSGRTNGSEKAIHFVPMSKEIVSSFTSYIQCLTEMLEQNGPSIKKNVNPS